jgi:hypothetical protein
MAVETARAVKIRQGLVLTCPKCLVKNFLDPYPFWNFNGKTKCAGCNTIYVMQFVNGQLIEGPVEGDGEPDLLPGYAEDKDFQPITGAGKIRPAPQARADPFSGKPKATTKSIRGRPVSGRPLQPDELIGSRARFIVEQQPLKK